MIPIKKTNEAMRRRGAMAMAMAMAAAATPAHAATVQITFHNSFISTTPGNHLVTDFGGDGPLECWSSAAQQRVALVFAHLHLMFMEGAGPLGWGAAVNGYPGVWPACSLIEGAGRGQVGGRGPILDGSWAAVRGVVAGGAAYVATAVPEPSGLGLLAAGAGGLLTRRRRGLHASQRGEGADHVCQ